MSIHRRNLSHTRLGHEGVLDGAELARHKGFRLDGRAFGRGVLNAPVERPQQAEPANMERTATRSKATGRTTGSTGIQVPQPPMHMRGIVPLEALVGYERTDDARREKQSVSFRTPPDEFVRHQFAAGDSRTFDNIGTEAPGDDGNNSSDSRDLDVDPAVVLSRRHTIVRDRDPHIENGHTTERAQTRLASSGTNLFGDGYGYGESTGNGNASRATMRRDMDAYGAAGGRTLRQAPDVAAVSARPRGSVRNRTASVVVSHAPISRRLRVTVQAPPSHLQASRRRRRNSPMLRHRSTQFAHAVERENRIADFEDDNDDYDDNNADDYDDYDDGRRQRARPEEEEDDETDAPQEVEGDNYFERPRPYCDRTTRRGRGGGNNSNNGIATRSTRTQSRVLRGGGMRDHANGRHDKATRHVRQKNETRRSRAASRRNSTTAAAIAYSENESESESDAYSDVPEVGSYDDVDSKRTEHASPRGHSIGNRKDDENDLLPEARTRKSTAKMAKRRTPEPRYLIALHGDSIGLVSADAGVAVTPPAANDVPQNRVASATGIVGPQGPIGATGAAGSDGEHGEHGLPGERGLQGVQGARGPSGAPGRPGVTTIVPCSRCRNVVPGDAAQTATARARSFARRALAADGEEENEEEQEEDGQSDDSDGVYEFERANGRANSRSVYAARTPQRARVRHQSHMLPSTRDIRHGTSRQRTPPAPSHWPSSSSMAPPPQCHRAPTFGHFTWTPTQPTLVGVNNSLPLRACYASGIRAISRPLLPHAGQEATSVAAKEERDKTSAPTAAPVQAASGTDIVITTADGQAGVFKIHFSATPAHAAQIGLWLDDDGMLVPAERIAGAGPRRPPATAAEDIDGDESCAHIAKTLIVELHSGARLRLMLVSTHRGASGIFDPRVGGTALASVAELTIEQMPVATGAYRD